MAKHIVVMSCGHEQEVQLFGKSDERERKIRYYEEYGLCKECYKKTKDEENKKIGLLFHAKMMSRIDERTGDFLIEVWFSGDTIPYKEQIKANKYKWTRRISDPYEMCWSKTIKLDDLDDEIEWTEKLGASYTGSKDDLFANSEYSHAIARKKKIQDQLDAISKLEKPSMPEILKNHKWNGTIYGKAGNHAIYLDGDKVQISNETVEEIKTYQTNTDEYNKKVIEIKTKI